MYNPYTPYRDRVAPALPSSDDSDDDSSDDEQQPTTHLPLLTAASSDDDDDAHMTAPREDSSSDDDDDMVVAAAAAASSSSPLASLTAAAADQPKYHDVGSVFYCSRNIALSTSFHGQKWKIVMAGLRMAGIRAGDLHKGSYYFVEALAARNGPLDAVRPLVKNIILNLRLTMLDDFVISYQPIVAFYVSKCIDVLLATTYEFVANCKKGIRAYSPAADHACGFLYASFKYLAVYAKKGRICRYLKAYMFDAPRQMCAAPEVHEAHMKYSEAVDAIRADSHSALSISEIRALLAKHGAGAVEIPTSMDARALVELYFFVQYYVAGDIRCLFFALRLIFGCNSVLTCKGDAQAYDSCAKGSKIMFKRVNFQDCMGSQKVEDDNLDFALDQRFFPKRPGPLFGDSVSRKFTYDLLLWRVFEYCIGHGPTRKKMPLRIKFAQQMRSMYLDLRLREDAYMCFVHAVLTALAPDDQLSSSMRADTGTKVDPKAPDDSVLARDFYEPQFTMCTERMYGHFNDIGTECNINIMRCNYTAEDMISQLDSGPNKHPAIDAHWVEMYHQIQSAPTLHITPKRPSPAPVVSSDSDSDSPAKKRPKASSTKRARFKHPMLQNAWEWSRDNSRWKDAPRGTPFLPPPPTVKRPVAAAASSSFALPMPPPLALPPAPLFVDASPAAAASSSSITAFEISLGPYTASVWNDDGLLRFASPKDAASFRRVPLKFAIEEYEKSDHTPSARKSLLRAFQTENGLVDQIRRLPFFDEAGIMCDAHPEFNSQPVASTTEYGKRPYWLVMRSKARNQLIRVWLKDVEPRGDWFTCSAVLDDQPFKMRIRAWDPEYPAHAPSIDALKSDLGLPNSRHTIHVTLYQMSGAPKAWLVSRDMSVNNAVCFDWDAEHSRGTWRRLWEMLLWRFVLGCEGADRNIPFDPVTRQFLSLDEYATLISDEQQERRNVFALMKESKGKFIKPLLKQYDKKQLKTTLAGWLEIVEKRMTDSGPPSKVLSRVHERLEETKRRLRHFGRLK